MRQLLDFDLDRIGELSPYVVWGRVAAASYLQVIVASYLLPFLKLVPGPIPSLGHVAHASVLTLQRQQEPIPSSSRLRQAIVLLVTSALRQLDAAYSEDSWNPDHPVGPFSSIRLGDLALLAKRDERLLKRYGAGHLAGIFEQQLALVVQSLGFYVVSTRTGESTVDLVCVSADPREPVTILVEAKTTKRAYGLPTKDARALKAYVQDVKKTLTTLPTLRFVLIVSHEAAKTLESKLRTLEAEVGVPVRFTHAQSIASLRELVPGPAPVSALVRGILEGPPVLTESFVNEVVARYKAEQDAHASFVRSMVGEKSFQPGGSSLDE